ncbi:MAG: exonuclease SbcCD subunit D [Maioricimonas sp. JB045]
MPSRSAFQFLHAADLVLDAPVFGVADLPAAARDVLLDARYLAARRVFDVALESDVDFVVLAGNVLDTGYGVRAAYFLAEQFDRLEQARIPVYWVERTVTGAVEWPRFVPWPQNVFRADANFGQVWEVSRAGRSLARVVACRDDAAHRSEPADMTFDGRKTFEIRVVPGSHLNAAPRALADYWALGGQQGPLSVPGTGGRARFCGQPQGMHPTEVGPRGCQVVTVDQDGRMYHQFVETNAVRWYSETISLDAGSDRLSLRTAVESRYRRIASETSARLAMVHWNMSGHGELMQTLHGEAASGELLATLRSLAPQRSTVWTMSADVVADHAHTGSLKTDDPLLAAVMEELEQLELDDPQLRAILEELAGQFGDDLSIPEPKFVERVRQRARAEVIRRSGDSDSLRT